MSTGLDERDVFDAVVIGSGFGGAVVAHQLAEHGLSDILVLERGLPYPPGSFARTPWEWRENVWAPDDRQARCGLFEILRFRHVTAVLAAGLGGGSLIYANVLLKKPADTFGADEVNGWREWPLDYQALDAAYDSVLARLAPNPNHFPYSSYRAPKPDEWGDAVRRAGLSPEPAPLAISFSARHGGDAEPGVTLVRDDGGVDRDNVHGRPRRTCTLSGSCDFGCNDGAKNTLDFTFLSDFVRHGNGRKLIRTCCEATRIRGPKDGGGYDVTYRQHASAKEAVRRRAREEEHPGDEDLLDPDERPERVIHAKILILAGGTFGSTKLLLRSQPTLPPLSPQLGRGFSSNGDLLKFARRCRTDDGRWRRLEPSRGPVITRYAESEHAGHRVWLEDGGYPLGMEMLWQLTDAPGAAWRMRGTALRWLRHRLLGNVGPAYVEAVGDAHASAAMMPLLAMGRDVAGGQIRLKRDSLTLDWDPDGESDHYFTFAEKETARVADKLGGTLAAGGRLFGRGLTAHSLGGCRMGNHAGEGVVDARGNVFGCQGLYVADGSVMPAAVGPNPSLTIAAFAYHIAERAAAYWESVR